MFKQQRFLPGIFWLASILIMVMAIGSIFSGCSDDPVKPDPVNTNSSPEIEMTQAPADEVFSNEACQFSWKGSDTDGTIAGYYYDLDKSTPETWTTNSTCTMTDIPVGEHSFYIRAKDDDGALSKIISATFTVVELTSDCAVSQSSLGFGSVDVGSSASLTFTITNNGTGTLAGNVSESCDHYSFTAGGGAYSLAPSAVHSVTVKFEPDVAGTHTCTIDLGEDACVDVSCTGIGLDTADCAVSESTLDFGDVNVGSGAELGFTVTNNGTGTLAGNVSESCDHYSFTAGGGAYSLAPGAVHSVTVKFEPDVAGTHTCTIDLGGNACADVTCTGVGAESVNCVVSPASLDFASVMVTSNSTRSFEIINNGTGSLNGTLNESAPHFRIISGGGAYDIPPGGSREVTVEFEPTMVGNHTGNIDLGLAACSEVSCSGYGDGVYGDVEFNDRMVCADIQPWSLAGVNGGTYTFNLTDDCPEIEPGDILVGSGPGGAESSYLRKVTGLVSQSQNQIVLNTTFGSLIDGIERCDIDEQFSLPVELPDTEDFLLDGVEVHGDTLSMDGFVLVDQDINIPPFWFHLFAGLDRAYVTLSSPTLDFALQVRDAELTEYYSLYHSEVAFGCDFTVIVAGGLEYDFPDTELYKKTVKKVTMVWFVPVVHKITTTVTLKAHLGLMGQLDTSIEGLGVSQSIDIGARYLAPTWENLNDVELSLMPPTVEMSAYAEATLRPSIEIKVVDKLYGVAGPAGWVEPYIEGVASTHIFQDFCLDVDVGCDVGCGIEGLDMLGLPGDVLQFDFPLINMSVYHNCWPWP